ncbi:unnamed protein product [Ectocarpus sp. 8 AP-2014]
MARSPAALSRLLVVATLCLLSAPNTVVPRVDAQSRDCSDLLLACDESDFCSACLLPRASRRSRTANRRSLRTSSCANSRSTMSAATTRRRATTASATR